MQPRFWFHAALLVALTAQTALCSETKHHVVVVVWDGMRPDFISEETTPALAKLAKVAQTQTKCKHQLDDLPGIGFSDGGGFKNQHYCGNKAKDPEIVFWLSNMDVDCDGSGNCSNDKDHQPSTTFEFNSKALNAQTVPYVVVNQSPKFNFINTGLKGLGLVAIVCGTNMDKLIYGCVGDTNPLNQIGEAAISVAQACFGNEVNGNNASPLPVLYVGVTGESAVAKEITASAIANLGTSILPKIETLAQGITV